MRYVIAGLFAVTSLLALAQGELERALLWLILSHLQLMWAER